MPRHLVHRAQKLFDPRYTREPRHKHLELHQARTRKRTLFRHSMRQERRQDQATRIRFLGVNVYRMRAAHFGGPHPARTILGRRTPQTLWNFVSDSAQLSDVEL